MGGRTKWGYATPTTVTKLVQGDMLEKVYKLVKSTRSIEGIHTSGAPLAATIAFASEESKKGTIYVRWMGQNPGAVSFDDMHLLLGRRR
jgi:hypothetical protein